MLQACPNEAAACPWALHLQPLQNQLAQQRPLVLLLLLALPQALPSTRILAPLPSLRYPSRLQAPPLLALLTISTAAQVQ